MTSQKLVAVLLLSASVLVSVVESECPDAEAIQPCTCQTENYEAFLYCGELSDASVLEKVAANSNGYKYVRVYVEWSTIQFIPKVFVETIPTSLLCLRDLTLSRLVDSIPDTSEKLTDVWLMNLKILNGFSWEVFTNMPNLQYVMIYNTPVPGIKAEFNKYVSHNLTQLEMEFTGITEIEEDAFQGFQNLRWLFLSNNKLTSLRRDSFPVPFNVGFLRLQNNTLTTIPDDFFSEMPTLREVDLNGNLIASINEEVFSTVVNATVDLSSNPIKCDCNLKWIADREAKNIVGSCVDPKRLFGKPLRELSQSDFDC